MAKCPVVHGVPADGADDREPEARQARPFGEGRCATPPATAVSGGDDAHHRIDDRRVSGNTEIRTDAAPDEQVPGEAESARDGEQVTTERGAVDAEVAARR